MLMVLHGLSVCHFIFEEVNLGGSLLVNLTGKNALILEAKSGDFILGTDIKADGGSASIANNKEGFGIIGGYNGVPPGQLPGDGPGAPGEGSEYGHGASHGGHGSGGALIAGSHLINDLLGGSSGGSSDRDGSGAGGGAIQLKAAGAIIIKPNVTLSANGGNGARSSASGSGGSIRMDAQTIENFGTIEAKSGQGVKLAGANQTRGSSGGRVAFYAQAEVFRGNVDVSGEWNTNHGSIFVGGGYQESSINLQHGHLIFDTKSGYFLWKEVLWYWLIFISNFHGRFL